jgi:hypothetical protein
MDDVRPKVLLEKILAWREKLLVHWIYYCSTNMYKEKNQETASSKDVIKGAAAGKEFF